MSKSIAAATAIPAQRQARAIDGDVLRRLRLAFIAGDADFPKTLAGFAKRVGLSRSYVSQVEHGDRNPSYGAVRWIAERGFGISVYALWCGDAS